MAFKPSFDKEKGTVKVLVRLSYFKGFQKTASTEGGKLMYRTNGLMVIGTPDGDASIKAAQDGIVALIKKEWPGKDPVKFMKSLDSKRRGLFRGDDYVDAEGEVREHYGNTRYLKLTNDKKPKYKNRRGEDVDEEERDDMFFSGAWAIAYYHYYAVRDKAKGGNGIFTTLDALQYYKKDEPFQGGGIDDDEIDDLGEDDEDDFDSSAGKKGKKSSSIDDDDDDLGI